MKCGKGLPSRIAKSSISTAWTERKVAVLNGTKRELSPRSPPPIFTAMKRRARESHNAIKLRVGRYPLWDAINHKENHHVGFQ